ncbi:xanthine dehydrogenase family protein subunit M [Phenylobacterium sp. LjRoot225]|uniref:FAD binding domain-containing protein n=1 Tax=Phenylobacterium sp. LjRoot225 TaxID=3342285 RepID=UPI003ECF8AD5
MIRSYLQPATGQEAALALAAGARPLAGGTDLLVQVRAGRIAPDAVVDLKRIPRAIGIRRQDGGFVIGAATPCRVLAANDDLVDAWPGVVEAADLIGSVQVRNRATLGGNLCNASPAADSVPALIAASARCVILGPDGERELAVEDVPLSPGRHALEPGEFVLEFVLPAQPARTADAYLRATPRTEMDIAVAGAGVSLTLDEAGVCTAARVALGAVAPTALLVAEAGAALVGSRLDDTALIAMEAAVRAACRPISDKRGTADYRIAAAAVLSRRAAKIAYARAAAST